MKKIFLTYLKKKDSTRNPNPNLKQLKSIRIEPDSQRKIISVNRTRPQKIWLSDPIQGHILED